MACVPSSRDRWRTRAIINSNWPYVSALDIFSHSRWQIVVIGLTRYAKKIRSEPMKNKSRTWWNSTTASVWIPRSPSLFSPLFFSFIFNPKYLGSSWFPYGKKNSFQTHFSQLIQTFLFLRYAVVHHTSPIAAHSLRPAMRPMTQKVGWYIVERTNDEERRIENIKRFFSVSVGSSLESDVFLNRRRLMKKRGSWSLRLL